MSRKTCSVNRAVSDPVKGMLVKRRLSVYYKLLNSFSAGTTTAPNPPREIRFPIRFSLRSLCPNLRLLLHSWNVLRINHPILFAWMSCDYKNTWPKVCDQLIITSTPCICFHIDVAFSYWSKTCWGSSQWEMWGLKAGLICNRCRLYCIMIILCRFLLGSESLLCCSSPRWVHVVRDMLCTKLSKLEPCKNSHRLVTNWRCCSLIPDISLVLHWDIIKQKWELWKRFRHFHEIFENCNWPSFLWDSSHSLASKSKGQEFYPFSFSCFYNWNRFKHLPSIIQTFWLQAKFSH